ncbi:MAG: hypothetical protein ABW137_12570 [Mycobacterium sp.]
MLRWSRIAGVRTSTVGTRGVRTHGVGPTSLSDLLRDGLVARLVGRTLLCIGPAIRLVGRTLLRRRLRVAPFGVIRGGPIGGSVARGLLRT